MSKVMFNYRLVIFLIFILCFVVTGCKKREPESPFESQLPGSDAILTIDINEEFSNLSVIEELNEEPEVMSIELDSSMFISPTAKQMQAALKNAGYYFGKIDGKIGPKSKKAISDFQRENNLKVDGKVGKKTWSKLKGYLDS